VTYLTEEGAFDFTFILLSFAMRHVCLGRFRKSDLLDKTLPLMAMVATSSLSDSNSEGPEKATRGGGVNGSQSKFLTGTWPISHNQLNAPLF
jgi:hypothetical protein